jgi:hypothetical protein
MMVHLGFTWHPEYSVRELPYPLHQERYRAEVTILGDYPHEQPPFRFCADGSTVELAVHRAAYVALTMLRSTYRCFDDSPFRYVPGGRITSDGVHVTDCMDPQKEDDRLYRTAQFGHCHDRFVRALLSEIDTTRQQLREAVQYLALFSATRPSYYTFPPRFELPETSTLPDVGGYVPERGALLSVDPAAPSYRPRAYGIQGPDAFFFDTPRLRLPYDQHSRGRRASRWA